MTDQSVPRLVVRLCMRPRLLPALLRAAWRFRRRDWYRRAPFLPLPASEYLDWRLETAYGTGSAAPSVDEVESYLHWITRMTPRGSSR